MEEEIFKKCVFVPKLLLEYGFCREKDFYLYHKRILNDEFEIIITVHNQDVQGKIIDLSTNLEYYQYRLNAIGNYAGNIKKLFIQLLEDIKNKCAVIHPFLFPQSNRISEWIRKQYGDLPEFLWENDDKNGVFRNQYNKKWYGIIMAISKSKIDDGDEIVEVMNVKLPSDMIEKLIQKKGYYFAYHINKKYWITILLDDTIKDDEIKSLIEISYSYTLMYKK